MINIDFDLLTEGLYGLNIDDTGDVKYNKTYLKPYDVYNNIDDKKTYDAIDKKPWKPDPWQEKIYTSIQNAKDNIILVPPGAGKTYPVLGSYYGLFRSRLLYPKKGNFFNDLEHDDFPRLAYVVPTKQLAIEIYNQEIQRGKEYGLFQLFIRNLDKFKANIGDAKYLKNMVPNLTEKDLESNKIPIEIQNYVYSLTKKIISIQIGGSNQDDIFYNGKIPKPIIVGTYNPIKKLLEKHSKWYNIVVVDESQQFIPLPTDYYLDKNLSDKVSSFIDIVKYAKSNKENGCVQLMTGSVNLKSVESLRNIFNENFSKSRYFYIKAYGNNTAVDTEDINGGKKDVIDPNTGQHLKIGNRADMVVLPYEKLGGTAIDSRKAIIDLIQRKVKEKSYWNVVAIFSVKRTAKKGIYSMIDEALDGF